MPEKTIEAKEAVMTLILVLVIAGAVAYSSGLALVMPSLATLIGLPSAGVLLALLLVLGGGAFVKIVAAVADRDIRESLDTAPPRGEDHAREARRARHHPLTGTELTMALHQPKMPWHLRRWIIGMILRGELVLTRRVVSAPNGDLELTLTSRTQHDHDRPQE